MDEGAKKPDRLDVDAIWQKLNASRPGNKQAFDRLWHGFSSDVSRPSKPCSSRLDTTQKRTQQLKLDPLLSKLAAARKAPETVLEQKAPEPATCLEGAALERLVQALQSPDGCVRRAAVRQVQVGQPICCLCFRYPNVFAT
jgi:hypothetical protein